MGLECSTGMNDHLSWHLSDLSCTICPYLISKVHGLIVLSMVNFIWSSQKGEAIFKGDRNSLFEVGFLCDVSMEGQSAPVLCEGC